MRIEGRAFAAVFLTLTSVLGACASTGPRTAAAGLTPPSTSPVRTVTGDPLADTLNEDSLALRVPTVELRRFTSPALSRSMPYYAYLPPAYDRTADRYPVLYMLHGMGGSREEWRSLGLLDTADRLIRTGQLEPMIIVLPQGDQAYWVDHANGGEKWGAYTAHDLVEEIDARYRTVPARARRAIGGLSMGAHGALQLALNYPDTFGVVGAHSLVLRRFGNAPKFFGGPNDYAKRDPMTMVRAKPDLARTLSLAIDIGEQDPWTPLARQFNKVLDDLRIVHQWRVMPGDHSSAYWRANLADYLRFYGRAFGAR